MPRGQIYSRTFDGNTEQLDAIRVFTLDAIAKLGGSEYDLWACELAVDEAAANAFEHAYEAKGGRVKVSARRESREVIISVTNWGKPFDPKQIPEPNLSLPLDQRPAGGLGIYLIRHLMREVDFVFDARRGNSIIMRRTLNGTSQKAIDGGHT